MMPEKANLGKRCIFPWLGRWHQGAPRERELGLELTTSPTPQAELGGRTSKKMELGYEAQGPPPVAQLLREHYIQAQEPAGSLWHSNHSRQEVCVVYPRKICFLKDDTGKVIIIRYRTKIKDRAKER